MAGRLINWKMMGYLIEFQSFEVAASVVLNIAGGGING